MLMFSLLHIGNVGNSNKQFIVSFNKPGVLLLAVPPGASPTEAFICERFLLAVGLMQKHGVPASIILAQAIVESDRGRSKLCKETNNHFGVKCRKDCDKDDHVWKDDRGVWSKFIVYSSPLESFEDHSRRLSSGRYRFLRCELGKDWEAWCDSLQKKGYAVDKQYASKLKQIIRKHRLYEYDNYATQPGISQPAWFP